MTDDASALAERQRIVAYLLEEVEDDMAYHQNHGPTELSCMAVMRAGYYRQAAAFIERGSHLIEGRMRPSWSPSSPPLPDTGLQA